MHPCFPRILFTAALAALASNCAGVPAQRTGNADGYGPNPDLPRPAPTLIPTVNIAEAKGWQQGGMPTPAKGLRVNAFATVYRSSVVFGTWRPSLSSQSLRIQYDR